MKKKILSLLIASVLVLAFGLSAYAAEAPNLDGKGSLSFKMDVDGVLLDSGSLNMFYVATISEMEENRYDFRLLESLSDAGATLNNDNLYDDTQAENLLKIAKTELVNYLTTPIEEGRALFTDLSAGLYLVWQNEENASEGYQAIKPFLISIPAMRDGSYVMDVEADPKVPLETEPSPPPPPPPPPPPEVPDTGQLNWPIPVMAIVGVMLLITGWILCLRRKRIEDEE